MSTRKFANFYPGMVILTLLFLPIAQAASTLSPNQSVAEIVAQQQEIRSKVKAATETNGWEEIPQQKREELLSRQDRLLALLDGKQSIAELDKPDQAEAISSLEWINAVADSAEDERLVCNRERVTGSHRVTRVCKTVAQIRKQREMTRAALLQGDPGARRQIPSGSER